MVVHRFEFNENIDWFALSLIDANGSEIKGSEMKRFRSISMMNLNAAQNSEIRLESEREHIAVEFGQRMKLPKMNSYNGTYNSVWSFDSYPHKGLHFTLEVIEEFSGTPIPIHVKFEQIPLNFF